MLKAVPSSPTLSEFKVPIVSLSPPTSKDLEDLTAFEFANRAFFEASINARPLSYYAAGGIQEAIDTAIREAAEDKGYQFLARNADGALVARVNLARVRREHFQGAELGYRVAQSHIGKGYATEAVRLALHIAFQTLKLHRIEASVRPDNTGSIQVLLRNGFTQYGRSTSSFQLAGQWHDLCHFECHTAP